MIYHISDLCAPISTIVSAYAVDPIGLLDLGLCSQYGAAASRDCVIRDRECSARASRLHATKHHASRFVQGDKKR
jgi:hypothetical protein